MAKRTTYTEALQRFETLVDCARPVLLKAASDGLEEAPHLLAFGKQCVDLARSAEGPMRRVASLRQMQNDYLIYWNEAPGPHVSAFWNAVRKAGLDLERVDHLARVLKRGRITKREEYETVVDSLVGAEQEGRITAEEAERLSAMIGAFEDRNAS
jgi:hypothetical protein